MSAISTIAPLRLEAKRKFNGIEFNHKEFRDGTGLDLYTAKFRGLDPQIGNKEEERVIKGSEQSTARNLGEIKDGEVTRTDHFGTMYNTMGPLSTELDVPPATISTDPNRKYDDGE